MRRLAAVFLIWAGTLPVHAQSAADLLTGGARMRGIVVPLYDKADHSESSIIRVDRAYTGLEPKKSFLVGAAPVAVLEGVTIEIRQTNRVTNCLDRLNQWLSPQNSTHLELRHASIEYSLTNRLEAGRVQVAKNGEWKLLGGVTLVDGDHTVQSPQATFYTLGDRAGEIVLVTSTNRYFLGPLKPPGSK